MPNRLRVLILLLFAILLCACQAETPEPAPAATLVPRKNMPPTAAARRTATPGSLPPTAVSPTSAPFVSLDASVMYRLTNELLGESRDLDTSTDGKNTPFMGKSADNTSGSHWKLSPMEDGTYRLSNEYLGDVLSLDTYSDGQNAPFMGKSADNTSGSYWKLIPLEDGSFRLTNEFLGGTRDLEVSADGQNALLMGKTADNTKASRWKLTPLTSNTPAQSTPGAASPAAASACKLPLSAATNVGLGFPKMADRLSSTGTVNVIVLFVDFPDVPATVKPEDVFALVSPGAEAFYKDISYGRMQLVLQPHFKWLRLSQPSAHYGEALNSADGHRAFIQEAVSLADPDVDFSKADSVALMANPKASALTKGPAFAGSPGFGIQADGAVLSNALTSGVDMPGWGFLWLNHEMGHDMSLVDLYDFKWDRENYDDLFKFTGDFSLMDDIAGKAPGYFAFERWQLGWLDDNQIVCQLNNDAVTSLSALESAGGVKAVMVPVGATKAVIVESRRAAGYDQKMVKPGALVYTVDTSIQTGQGPIVVYPALDGDPLRDKSPLAKGESVSVDGVTITVVDANDAGDSVHVTIAK